jgi:hypothetical protein
MMKLKETLNAHLTPQRKALLKSYARHIAGAGVTVSLLLLTDMAPQYAVLIGAVFGPAVKWADKSEKEYGLISAQVIKKTSKVATATVKKTK